MTLLIPAAIAIIVALALIRKPKPRQSETIAERQLRENDEELITVVLPTINNHQK